MSLKQKIRPRSAAILTIAFAVSAPVMAEPKSFVDPEMAKYETSLDADVKANCPAKQPIKYMQCAKEKRKQSEQQFPRRGTDRYCETHYANLTEAAAKAKVEELYSLSDGVREYISVDGPKGEVTQGQLQSEAQWIRLNVLHVKVTKVRIQEGH